MPINYNAAKWKKKKIYLLTLTRAKNTELFLMNNTFIFATVLLKCMSSLWNIMFINILWKANNTSTV